MYIPYYHLGLRVLAPQDYVNTYSTRRLITQGVFVYFLTVFTF